MRTVRLFFSKVLSGEPVAVASLIISTILGVLALVVALPEFITGVQSLVPTQKLKLYNSSETGLEIQYPENWLQKDTSDVLTGEIVEFISPLENSKDKFRESVSISIELIQPSRSSLDEYTEDSIKIIENYSDAKFSEIRKDILAGRNARLVIYDSRENENLFRIKQIWTVKNNRAYIVTYIADSKKYDKFLRDANKIISSFKIADEFNSIRGEEEILEIE